MSRETIFKPLAAEGLSFCFDHEIENALPTKVRGQSVKMVGAIKVIETARQVARS